METLAPRLSSAIALATVALWAPQARATLTLYNNNCVSCHSSATTTCDGCHAHGVHSSSAKNDINLAGTTDKVSYAPGSPVKVTVNAGYRTDWVRVVLFDQSLKEIARSSCPGGAGGCTTSVVPVTLTAPAPATPGTYIWAVAWYGNNFDINGASFGSGTSSSLKVGFFSADVNNPNHGYQTVALPAFSVTTASTPAIVLNPTSLDFQTVAIGGSKTLSTQVQSASTVPLSVTGISSCAGTPGSLTWAPAAPLTVAAGGSATLRVTFAPTAAGALPAGACLAIASNDPAKPTVKLGVSGTAAGTAGPALLLEPASLDFQSVVIGAPRKLTTQVHNAGGAALDLTSIALCSGTPTTINWTPSAPASVAPGASLTLNVFYTPAAADALPAGSCLVIASNDPANASARLSVSGAGSSGFTFEPPIGCSSGGSTGNFVGLAALLSLVARRRSRRARTLPTSFGILHVSAAATPDVVGSGRTGCAYKRALR